MRVPQGAPGGPLALASRGPLRYGMGLGVCNKGGCGMIVFRHLAISAVVLMGVACWFAAPALAQEVTPGEWHYSTVMDMPGVAMPTVPPEELAKMPPEVRARIERMMHGRNVEYSACVTARKASPQLPKHLDCTVDKMRRDGDRLSWSATCHMRNGATSHADAVATYHAHRMAMDMTMQTTTPAGGPMVTHIHTTGGYVGPCQTR
jgi:Protein of unknown function (DUF3617)